MAKVKKKLLIDTIIVRANEKIIPLIGLMTSIKIIASIIDPAETYIYKTKSDAKKLREAKEMEDEVKKRCAS